MKIVVFDLDETLGYFVEFGIFCDILDRYLAQYEKYTKELTQHEFNNILDLYPEFLRPNIINILSYLKKKKQTNCCHKIMIYTNNQGPKKWAHNLSSYFESKLNFKIFDQIIAAFKINGKRVEICRSSHDKSYNDLIKCTKIPMNAEICFLDDNYFPEMSHNNLYYINVKPYTYDLPIEEMVTRFCNSNIYDELIQNKDKDTFKKFAINSFVEYNFPIKEKHRNDTMIDKILSKQIMIHLEEFFNKTIKKREIMKTTNIKTKKNGRNRKNKTIRNY